MSSQTLLLRSADRSSGNSSDFWINELPTTLEGDYIVKNVALINTVNTIRTGINDTLQFVYGVTPKTATVAAGVYSTGAALATAVQTAMNAQQNNFTVTYSSTTEKLTITSSGSNFTLVSGQIFLVIGFDLTASASSTAAASQVSDNFINLNPLLSVSINCQQSLRASWESICPAPKSGSIYVPLARTWGSTESYTALDLMQTLSFNRSKNVRFIVCDTSNNTVSLNGSEWEILLEKKKY